MTSSFEQPVAGEQRPRSAGTRQRLLDAAAELIGELGWARVTTRAVAERAGLPLGAVSYHFRSKQELLAQAALGAVEGVFPLGEFASVETLPELIGLIDRSFEPENTAGWGLSAVLVETLREAGQDPVLRERMARLLADYRRLLTELLVREQRRGAVSSAVDPSAAAVVIAAVGDGLLLHTLVDPELAVSAAMTSLAGMLSGFPSSTRTGS